MPDRVTVSGIRFHARHGATRIERELGVRYAVDVIMDCNLSRSMASDRLEDTVDYAQVHAVVLEVARQRSMHLMETLAGELADRLLGAFPVDTVHLKVRKETPVLDGIVDWVGVEISRSRGEAPRRSS